MASIDIKGILDKRNKNRLIINGKNYDIYDDEEDYIFDIESIQQSYEVSDVENITKILRRKDKLKSDKKDKEVKKERENKGNQWLYENLKIKFKFLRINEELYFYNREFGYYELLKDTKLDSFIRDRASEEDKKYINRGIILETIGWIKADRKIEVDTRIKEIDPVRYINFKNCIYDIYEDRTLPHSEEYIFTSYIDCN